jgi:hypothetical protein
VCLALRFGAALGLGLLLGLERERKRDAELLFGGVRTFALVALLGGIVIAVLSNTLVKTGVAVFVGTPALCRTLLLAALLMLSAAAVGAVIVGYSS